MSLAWTTGWVQVVLGRIEVTPADVARLRDGDIVRYEPARTVLLRSDGLRAHATLTQQDGKLLARVMEKLPRHTDAKVMVFGPRRSLYDLRELPAFDTGATFTLNDGPLLLHWAGEPFADAQQWQAADKPAIKVVKLLSRTP